MSWSGRRRTLYFFAFFVVIAGVLFVLGYAAFYEAPTCTDGKQNGMEQGIDCGGECPVVCSFSAAEPNVAWSRLIEVIPGVYTVVALVENPNSGVGAENVPYTFKLRDANNLLVHEEKGTLYLPPNFAVPVFITGIQTGSRVPTRAEFALGNPIWGAEEPVPLDISIDDIELEREDSAPRLTAHLTNHRLDIIDELPLVAILYDEDENVLHASRTVVRNVLGEGAADLVFTWPQPLPREVGQIHIMSVPEPR